MIKLEQAVQFFREVKIETKKVTYPSRADTIQSTKVVIAVVLLVGIYLFGIDAILSYILSFIL